MREDPRKFKIKRVIEKQKSTCVTHFFLLERNFQVNNVLPKLYLTEKKQQILVAHREQLY